MIKMQQATAKTIPAVFNLRLLLSNVRLAMELTTTVNAIPEHNRYMRRDGSASRGCGYFSQTTQPSPGSEAY